ncbi:hypothetical protein GWK47_004066 [Chionoecetes opilio]|uniref:Uncharacterized protein n=1 Tax=Chionoecetes opilio TaxID=41210 RepID=A0A8J5CZG6_CHIOP|nr:hypothetical protein GWK47_004066 [Chionoecetes opilio]
MPIAKLADDLWQQFLHNMSLQCPQLRPMDNTQLSPCSPSWYPSFRQKSSLSRIRSRLRSLLSEAMQGPPLPLSTPQQRQYRPPAPTPQRRQQLRFRSEKPRTLLVPHNFGSKPQVRPPLLVPPAGIQRKRRLVLVQRYFSPNLIIAAPPSRQTLQLQFPDHTHRRRCQRYPRARQSTKPYLPSCIFCAV